MSDAWTDLQRRFNRESAGRRDGFAGHRRRVMELAAQAPADTAACVLGAGNCNDIDLPVLTARHQPLTLVDLDGDALHAALRRHDPAVANVCRTLGGADLDLGQPGDLEPATFGLVLSVGMLSQLLDRVLRTAPTPTAAVLEAVRQSRRRHLRLVADLLAPGGVGIVSLELVSSDTLPELPHTSAGELPSLLHRAAAAGNFYTGARPDAVVADLAADEHFAGRDLSVQVLAPWLWHFGPRTYAVYGLRLSR